MANDFKSVVKAITKSIEKFQKTIPKTQQAILDQLIKDLADLDLTGTGNIAVSVKNVRMITSVKARLMDIILNPEYKEAVKDYLKSFDQVTKLQNQYFTSVESRFKTPELGKEMQKQSMAAVTDNLTERGIDANVVLGVEHILRKAVTSGGSISELHQALRNEIINNAAGDGSLVKYTKQITTDALNQHSAQYTQIVSADLGLKWYRYVGSLIETSRPFCQACVEKEWIHESEFPALLNGDFPEFKKHDGKMYKGLPAGMYPDTTPSNFPINRGGYNCGHQLYPVREESVPAAVRALVGDL